MTRRRFGGARGPRVAAAVAGLALTVTLLVALVMPAWAQPAPPALTVLDTYVQEVVWAGEPHLDIRGNVKNEGPGVARRIWVNVAVHEEEGGPRIGAPGAAQPLLTVLAEGESSPFRALVRGCCPEEVHVAVTPTAEAGLIDRYRGLTPSINSSTQSERPAYFGQLANTGDGFPDVSNLNANAVFWFDEKIVAIQGVAMPQVPTGGQPVQSLRPGDRLPFWFRAPEVEHDRFELLIDAMPLPDGRYPVPFGTLESELAYDTGQLAVSSRVANCGRGAVSSAIVAATAIDASDQVLGYAWDLVEFIPPLPGPGFGRVVGSLNVDFATAEATDWELSGYALGLQASRPSDTACRAFHALRLPYLLKFDGAGWAAQRGAESLIEQPAEGARTVPHPFGGAR